MAIYTIILVYEIPAESQQQATDRMSEAIVLRVERDFHVKDYIREPGAKPGKGTPINLRPAASWLELALNERVIALQATRFRGKLCRSPAVRR